MRYSGRWQQPRLGPGLASVQSEIQDLTQAITVQHQQEGELQGTLGRLEQTGTKRDDVLG